MLDPDPDEMNADPQPWFATTLELDPAWLRFEPQSHPSLLHSEPLQLLACHFDVEPDWALA
jgi:hypothetical protein